MEQTKAKTAEEVRLARQEAAELIISKEADICAKETRTRTRWNDQLIEVQHMIMGAMIQFSDQENKELKSHIANLEAQKKSLTDMMISQSVSLIELSKENDKLKEFSNTQSSLKLEAQNKELREALQKVRDTMNDISKEASDGLIKLNETASKRHDANVNSMYDLEEDYYREIARYAWAYRAKQIVGYYILPIVQQALKEDKQDG